MLIMAAVAASWPQTADHNAAQGESRFGVTLMIISIETRSFGGHDD
jgi:hypothetical protein